MTNFKKLFKEALTPDYLKEDRKAKEYIQSIEDPEEREAEMKRMFGDDELDEATDFNDPALIKARAAQMKRAEMDKEEAEYKAKQSALDKKYGSNFMDKLDAELDLKGELSDLEQEREMLMIDMEEEAEPEGGEIADRYGERLNQIDQRIANIQEELDDLRMYESVNESKYRVEYTTQDGEDAKSQIYNSEEEADKKEKKLVDSGVKKSKVVKVNEGRSMAQFSYADKGSPIKVGDTLYKDGKAGKVIQKLDWKNQFNVEFDDDTMIPVPFSSVEGDKIVREISTTPVSGTKAGVIYSLDNRKYVLTNDVKGARIGDYTNITLPKGTVMYNLPGGLMADHESLRQYAKLSGNIYFDKPTYAGVGIRRMPDILTAIENNSNVIEESLNEELKLGVKYKLPTGETGYIMTGGSKDSKDWTFSANKEPYLSVKDKLKPTEKQPGKYDGAYDMGMGKGHHIDEGTCGYGEDGKIGDKPAGPDLNEMEDEIPAFMMRDGMYRELVDDSISYNDFEKRIYGFVGPKFYKSIHSEHPGALKNFYDKFRITNPNLEEESDTDVGGGAEQDNRDYNFSDADDGAYAEEHSGVVGENKEFDFKKMVKEALTPDYLKK